MEPEDLEDRLRRHEAMIEGLAKVWMRQSEMNARMDAAIERMDGYMARQDVLNERLIGAIERLDKTQADITLLLQQVLRGGSGNGREA
jgi:hypothetical protein